MRVTNACEAPANGSSGTERRGRVLVQREDRAPLAPVPRREQGRRRGQSLADDERAAAEPAVHGSPRARRRRWARAVEGLEQPRRDRGRLARLAPRCRRIHDRCRRRPVDPIPPRRRRRRRSATCRVLGQGLETCSSGSASRRPGRPGSTMALMATDAGEPATPRMTRRRHVVVFRGGWDAGRRRVGHRRSPVRRFAGRNSRRRSCPAQATGRAEAPGGRATIRRTCTRRIYGVRRRRHEAARRPAVRGRRRGPRGHRSDRAAGPAHCLGRLQPGPAAVVVTEPERRLGSPGSAARRSTSPTSARGSASARRSSSRASASRSTTAVTRSPTVTEDGSEIEWPVPFWWVDIGATMQNIMLAAVNEGAAGSLGRRSSRSAPTSASPTSRPDRRHARRAPAAGRAVTQPQARLGAAISSPAGRRGAPLSALTPGPEDPDPASSVCGGQSSASHSGASAAVLPLAK